MILDDNCSYNQINKILYLVEGLWLVLFQKLILRKSFTSLRDEKCELFLTEKIKRLKFLIVIIVVKLREYIATYGILKMRKTRSKFSP